MRPTTLTTVTRAMTATQAIEVVLSASDTEIHCRSGAKTSLGGHQDISLQTERLWLRGGNLTAVRTERPPMDLQLDRDMVTSGKLSVIMGDANITQARDQVEILTKNDLE
eukprot:Skav214587  [mRNA]  locus=scaffold57:367197:373757:+ [translate_table: standard]